MSAMIDASSNEVYSTTLNLPSMESTQIIKSLKTAFPGYPVDLLNDTACYSYAEKGLWQYKREKILLFSISAAASVPPFSQKEACLELPVVPLPSSAIIPSILTVRNVSAEITDVWKL